MSNGDTVNIQVNEKTGERTVTTTGPDGTVKTVKYNANDADSVDVNTRHPNGSTDELHRDGTTVSRSHQNGGIGGVIGGLLGGGKTTDTYSLDANGNPVRRHTGPGADNEVFTTANADGSTDKKNLIYRDDNGRPVYEETHQDPSFMWNPRPPRFPDPDPFPFPRPHPFPEPRPFPQPIPHWPPTEPPIWREPSWWREPRGGPDFDPRLLLESGKIVPFAATVNE